MLIVVSGGITSLWSYWSYRHEIFRRLSLLRRDYPRFKEILSTDQRSSYGGPLDQEIPLVSSDRTAETTSYRTREVLRRAVILGNGWFPALETSRLCGKIEWLPDDFNTMNYRIAYNEMLQGCSDDTSDDQIFTYRHPVRWLTNLRVLCGDRWYLDANQLLLARKLGIIKQLPNLSADQISDLNKEDISVKLLAISQIIRLCLQLSMRLSQGVPTTQLEVMTMGYALCSAITYIMLFDRPKDVTTVFEVGAARYTTSSEMSFIASKGPNTMGRYRSTVSIPNNSTHRDGLSLERALSSSFAVVLFGSLHFAA